MFLTPDELRELTGRVRRKDQIAWLETNHLRYWLNAAGKPVVARAEVHNPGAAVPEAGWTPDFSKVGA